MSGSGYPNAWPACSTTGHRNIGAVQKLRFGALAYPNAWPASASVGYRNIGAVQRGQTQAIIGAGFADADLFGGGVITQGAAPGSGGGGRGRCLGLGLGLGITRRTRI